MTEVERIGSATLICADARDVLPTIADASVDMLFGDPPYGIGYTKGGAPVGKRTRSTEQIGWDAIAGDDAVDGWWLPEALRVLRDGAAAYVCTRWDVEPEWRRQAAAAGFLVKQRLTWHKRVTGKGDLKGTYGQSCEDVLFLTKGRHILRGRPPMLLEVGCVPTFRMRHHPHQKPIGLPEALILASTKPGELVSDLMMGSGPAAAAAIRTGRRFLGVELERQYFDAACALAEAEAARTEGGQAA